MITILKNHLAIWGLVFGITLNCQAADTQLAPIEKARLRVFETLYQKDLTSLKQQQNFLRKNFRSVNGHDIYTFPNQTIDNAYKAYVNANLDNGLFENVLHKELPKTNKAFKGSFQKNNSLDYVLMYVWHGNTNLSVTTTGLDGENLCSKEVLEFSQKQNTTTLTTSFEQYCFAK